TGEGDPPDHALRFLRQMEAGGDLSHLQYALLALGDRSYDGFCAFGRQFDGWLRGRGARPLFDRVEVDNADEAALRRWQYAVGRIGGDTAGIDWSAPAYTPWRLVERRLLNPGSQGGPVHALSLQPVPGALPDWKPGDIAEIGPRNPPEQVDAWLARTGLDPQAQVDAGSGSDALAAAGGDRARAAAAAPRVFDRLNSRRAPVAVAGAREVPR